MSGSEPKELSTSQKNTVTTKPSLVLSSPLEPLEGNQKINPTKKVMAKARKKVCEVFSPYRSATKTGVSILRLKIINSMPRTRAMMAKCILGGSSRRS
jgi:hypothetical protein